MRIVSRANKREHWAKRRKREREQVAWLLAEMILGSDETPELPVTVTFTRIGATPQDDDNLPSSFKHLRDAITDRLIPEKTQSNQHRKWADDSDRRIEWKYRQEQGSYGCSITISPQ